MHRDIQYKCWRYFPVVASGHPNSSSPGDERRDSVRSKLRRAKNLVLQKLAPRAKSYSALNSQPSLWNETCSGAMQSFLWVVVVVIVARIPEAGACRTSSIPVALRYYSNSVGIERTTPCNTINTNTPRTSDLYVPAR